MLGKFIKTRLGAAVMAAALAFSTLSAAMPGEVAYAEETVTEEVTEVPEESATEEVTFENVAEEVEVNLSLDEALKGESVNLDVTEEVTDSASVEYEPPTDNIAEKPRVRVSGKLVGDTVDRPLELLFKSYNGDSVTTTSRNGGYVVELLVYETYTVYLPGVKDYCLIDRYDEGVQIEIEGEGLNFDIEIMKLDSYAIAANISYETNDEEAMEAVLSESVMVFENGDFRKEVAIEYQLAYAEVPVGDYIVSIKNKNTNNVYMSKPYSFYYYVVDGYVDHHEIGISYTYDFPVTYGDYRTRDNEARIVCSFMDDDSTKFSDLSFNFVDENKKTYGPYTYNELKCGLIRLPINRSYEIELADPERTKYEISPWSDTLEPSKKHSGDGYYSYDVKLVKRIKVSGKLIGDAPTEPIELEFSTGYSDEDDRVFTTAINGQYTVELLENCEYGIFIPNAPMYAIDDERAEVLYFETGEEDFTYNIPVYLLDEYCIVTHFKFDSGYRDEKYEDNDLYDIFNDAVMVFESERCSKEEKLEIEGFDVYDLVIGEYIVTIKNKKGHVYMSKPYSFFVPNNSGYVDHKDYLWGDDYTFNIGYGDYRTRDKEAMIVCDFEGLDSSELYKSSFRFADSDNKCTSVYSYSELRLGLVRLPKDKKYKIIAENLPKGYEIDYEQMSTISPLAKHCGDGKYNYTVVLKKSDTQKPLKIVKDTEDIVAKNGSKISFKIEAEGTGLKYSWYYMKPGSSKFSKAGVYTNEYTRTAGKSTDGMQVYCMVTDASGKKVHGRVATLSLNNNIEITYPNGKNVTAAKGKKANFMIYATSDLKLTYNWYYMIPKSSGGDGKYHKAGCFSNTYTRSAASKIDGMQAYCLVTDSTGTQVKSDVITFNLKK